MMKINKTVLGNAALAAAFSAGFNSDWFKGQFAEIKREFDGGGLSPYVPWVLGAAAAYFLLGRK